MASPRVLGFVGLTLVLSLVLPAVPGPSLAGRIKQQYVDDNWIDDRYLYANQLDFVVATVLAVVDSGGSSRAPTVRIDVTERLRGGPPLGLLVVAWPAPHPQLGVADFADSADVPPPALLKALPPPGSHVLIAGAWAPAGTWTCDPVRRWFADSPRTPYRRAALHDWTERLRQQARDAARAARERATSEAARRAAEAKAQVDRERAWLDRERARRRDVDLDALVRASDAVLEADAPLDLRDEEPGRRVLMLHVRRWLFPPDSALAAPAIMRILAPDWEASLLQRWREGPHDDVPGPLVGDTLRGVVFLRTTWISGSIVGPQPSLRLADPAAGVLWSDAGLIDAVRAAAARRGKGPAEPVAACGASIREFVTGDSAQAASVALRLVRLSGTNRESASAVLSCAEGSAWSAPSVDDRWFPACAFAEPQYVVRGVRGSGSLPARRLQAVVESLATLPSLGAGWIDPSDSVTITLRRAAPEGERVFEATLDESTCVAVSALMHRLLHGTPAGWTVETFWRSVGTGAAEPWIERPAPPRATPPPLALAPSSLPPQRGLAFGLAVDAVSGLGLDRAFVRAPFQNRWCGTTNDGYFAVNRLTPGLVWLEGDRAGYRPGYSLARVEPGRLLPVVIPLTPIAGAVPERRRGLLAVPPLALGATEAQTTILVDDSSGAAAADAWVLLLRPGERAGGRTNADGSFHGERLGPGSARLLVRAAGHTPWSGDVRLLAAGADTLRVKLAPGAPGRYLGATRR